MTTSYSRPSAHYSQHWLLWIIPLVTAIVWIGGLLALLIVWFARGQPLYPSMSRSQTTAFISDTGTGNMQPLFAVVACTMAVGIVASLLLLHWLRRTGRMHPHTTRRQRVLHVLSIVFGVLGCFALVLLSGFDTIRYENLHRIFLFAFLLGLAVSAILTVFEFRSLSRAYPTDQYLKRAFRFKAGVLILILPAVVAFITCLGLAINVAAALEWSIALIFSSWLITFWYDFARGRRIQLEDQEVPASSAPDTAPAETRERLSV